MIVCSKSEPVLMTRNELDRCSAAFLRKNRFEQLLLYFQHHSKKKKKEKKEKRDKKDKKKRKDRLKADYEEAEGITTPSKERLTPTQLDTPVATKVKIYKYKILFEIGKHIAL